MAPKTNIHTHTILCDGENTPREMAEAAFRAGCPGLGFSAHTYIPFEEEWTLQKDGEMEYVRLIESMKEEYRGRMDIFLGLEYDIFSPKPQYDSYDYIIGSVHNVKIDGKCMSLDESKKTFVSLAEEHYGGDYLALCRDYFRLLETVPEITGCQVLGHFDLVTKFNEGNCLFDESSPEYVRAWEKALEKLIPSGVIFEINTGAISRGYRSQPYPARPILKRIRELGGKIIITSDSHSAATILSGFDIACAAAAECGFEEAYELTKDGFVPVSIK